MRDLALALPFLHILSSRIREILEKADFAKLQVQYPEMMLWIMIMGGVGGLETTERKWFAKLVADFRLALGVCHGHVRRLR